MLKTKAEAERALHNAFKAMDRKNYPPMYENEVSRSAGGRKTGVSQRRKPIDAPESAARRAL